MTPDPSDSAVNEWFARKTIRDLLHEHDGKRLIVEAKLSLWLEQEVTAYKTQKENQP